MLTKFHSSFNKNLASKCIRNFRPRLSCHNVLPCRSFVHLKRVRPSPLPLFSASSMQTWKQRSRFYEERRKIIPKLVYLHNPWKYLVTKFNLLKLQLFWDRDFQEKEFIRGSKQAAIVITDIIRTQNMSRIGYFTTPIGSQQITRDMLLSRNDSRLKLVQFETEHLRRAIPMKVTTRNKLGRKYAFIDMLFVGLRHTKDFDNTEDIVKINEILRKLDADLKTPSEITSVPHRIVFAEIFMRFRRDYSDKVLTDSMHKPSNIDKDWSVSFYKILTFDAAIVITDIIRAQDMSKVSHFTTPIGFQQITRDMLLSRNDSRLKLIQFEAEHLQRAIPMRVTTRKKLGRKYAFIDMLFVGLRNTKDFDNTEEIVKVKETLRKLDAELKVPPEVTSVPHRIIFAEIFMRFRRDYSDKALTESMNNENNNIDRDWSVSFYKILTFDILNYDPK